MNLTIAHPPRRAAGPRLDVQLLDVAQIVAAQLPRRVAGSNSGTRALLVAGLLAAALGGALALVQG